MCKGQQEPKDHSDMKMFIDARQSVLCQTNSHYISETSVVGSTHIASAKHSKALLV